MTLSDYILDIALIAVVALQIRGRRLSFRSLLIPVAIVGWAAAHYLHGVPTSGNDLVLVVLAAGVGLALGALSGLATRVTVGADGSPLARAGVVAAGLWVVGVGTRFAFQLYASHGGGPAIERFSAGHSINSSDAWGRRSHPDGDGRGPGPHRGHRGPGLRPGPAVPAPTEHHGRRWSRSVIPARRRPRPA